MAEWITPVFDRTLSDVSFAISKIAEWKKTGETNIYALKGCFNERDVNRIEGNIRYLRENLDKLYYFSNVVTRITWNIGETLTMADVLRIIGNTEDIISAYYQSNDAPDLPETLLNYEQVNSLEKNLHLIKIILDNMIASFRECNTFECGEE